jgi:hypothetical protein
MISIRIRADASPALRTLARIGKFPALKEEISSVAEKIQTTLQDHTPVGQPTPERGSGQLKAGWSHRIVVNGSKISAEFFNTAPNAEKILGYLETGTKPHPISPRNARVLRFYSRNQNPIFARLVHHPGTQPSALWTSAGEDVAGKIRGLRERLKTLLGS